MEIDEELAFFGESDYSDLVHADDFSEDGYFDLRNNVLTIGNVVDDINYIDEQTAQSCSLMAQEQFVHRRTNVNIPEEYLRWQAARWGVYSDKFGTIPEGLTSVLDHFSIPYEKSSHNSLDDLDRTLLENKDAIVNVNARKFYEDPTIPPFSKHAVSVVGIGVNPETDTIEGYYVTDSNAPKAAHFVDGKRLSSSWDGSLIAIPNQKPLIG